MPRSRLGAQHASTQESDTPQRNRAVVSAHLHALAERYAPERCIQDVHDAPLRYIPPTLLCLQCACGAVHTGRCPAGQPPCAPCACHLIRQAWGDAGAAGAPGRLEHRARAVALGPGAQARARRDARQRARQQVRRPGEGRPGESAPADLRAPSMRRSLLPADDAALSAPSCSLMRSPGRRSQPAASLLPCATNKPFRCHARSICALQCPVLAARRLPT
jgi:hypothetical protein